MNERFLLPPEGVCNKLAVSFTYSANGAVNPEFKDKERKNGIRIIN
jgi:hypothetical protein